MPRAARPRPGAVPWTELEVLRKKDGMGMRELSRLSGVSVSVISRCERGEVTPTWEVIGRLAATLDVPVSMLTPQRMRLSGLPRPTPAGDDAERDPAGDNPPAEVGAR